MQIPESFIPFGLGFLREPQPGSRTQANSELQAQAAATGAHKTAAATATATRPAVGPGPSNIAKAGNLDEAVQTLRAEGRLPARGSLIDLRA